MQTFKFPSRSEDTEHTVTVGANNHLSCTCRGFRTPSRCWHVREVAEKLGLPTTTRSNTPALPFEPARVIDIASRGTIVDAGYFVEPMLGRALKEMERLEHWCGKPGYSLEEKYNGHRCQLHVTPERIVIAWSRDQNRQELGAHLLNELSVLAPGVYDGELFIPGKNFSDVKRKDLRHRQKLALFDILGVYDGPVLISTRDIPLTFRRKLLREAMSRMHQLDVLQAPVYPVTVEMLQEIWNRGGEGVMVKNDQETYLPGKRSWIKFKKQQTTQVRITGFKVGKLGPHGVICAEDANGVKVQCKALDTKMRTAFDQNPDAWIGRTLVIEYQHRTDDGKYWHPRADHFED